MGGSLDCRCVLHTTRESEPWSRLEQLDSTAEHVFNNNRQLQSCADLQGKSRILSKPREVQEDWGRATQLCQSVLAAKSLLRPQPLFQGVKSCE